MMEIRELTEEEAEREIRQILIETPGLDAYDIAERLRIGVSFTHQLCLKLMRDGKIRSAASGKQGDKEMGE